MRVREKKGRHSDGTRGKPRHRLRHACKEVIEKERKTENDGDSG